MDPFQALSAYPQWITWRAEPHPDKPGATNKFALDWRNGWKHNPLDREIWTTPEVAETMAPAYDHGFGAGKGFSFSADDPFFFIDGDKMLQADGQWSPLAHEISARLGGAACEVSNSGTGLHWFGQYRGPRPAHGCRNQHLGLELYTADRFAAITGRGATGDSGRDCTEALAAIIVEWFPPTAGADVADWTDAPVAEWRGPIDDNDLIRKMLASAARSPTAAFGGQGASVTLAQLWEADADALGAWRPSTTGKAFDGSSADQALANHLAFWTGKNCARIERLMRRSALVRDKWDSARPSGTYLTETIAAACGFVSAVLQSQEAAVPDGPPRPAGVIQEDLLRTPNQEVMWQVHQIEHFKGCWFISDLGEMFVESHNQLMTRPIFDVVFGGHRFTVDAEGRKPSSSAWEAFCNNLVTKPRIASALCFRPELPTGAVIEEGVRTYVNSYVPYHCPMAQGDPSPFLDHLAKMLPVQSDRDILLAYMASLAQNPGVKFQWWPVIQGAKGNGKTLISKVMTYIMGEHYTHLPNAATMAREGMKFNSWIDRKLYIGVEEIALAHKRDFLQEFLTTVTNDRIPLEGKGTNQVTGDNRANGIIFTNPKDGVPIDKDERRYAVFYTAQQSAQDIVRDGMSGDYFPNLIDWLYGRGRYRGQPSGLAVMAGYVKSYVVPLALDPARALHRAPATSSTSEALTQSLGRAEQEVLEAIEEGRPGFAGGWVSSRFLDLLIDGIRPSVMVPRNKRRALMQALGYDWHPALSGGRTNDTVMPDGAKPKLYLKAHHLALNVDKPAEIARLYSVAQGAMAGAKVA